MRQERNLKSEYQTFLARHGLSELVQLPPYTFRELLEQRNGQAYRTEKTVAIDYRIWKAAAELPDGGDAIYRACFFDAINAEIHAALRDSGITPPGPTFVGEYPHRSFNAQACKVPGGTLLLINTGLMTLVHEVTQSLSSSILIGKRLPNGDWEWPEKEKKMAERQSQAATTLARSVLSYIFQNDSRYGDRQSRHDEDRDFIGFMLARATERFVVGHEFGHLLAGHLHGPHVRAGTDEWIRKSQEQEFAADEIGTLLLLQMCKNSPGNDESRSLERDMDMAGPFLFFAIDHLITRIRNEIDGIPDRLIVTDHPPSDQRASVLRRIIFELHGMSVLSMADCCTNWLSGQEERIIEAARQAMSEVGTVPQNESLTKRFIRKLQRRPGR